MKTVLAKRYVIDLNEKEPEWHDEGLLWAVTPTEIRHSVSMTDYVFPHDGTIYADLNDTGVHIGEMNANHQVVKLERVEE